MTSARVVQSFWNYHCRVLLIIQKRLRNNIGRLDFAWWRHQMWTFFALLALCAGNSPVTGEFPAKGLVTLSFDIFFELRRNKRLIQQSKGRWFETPSRSLWRHCNEMSFGGISYIVTAQTIPADTLCNNDVVITSKRRHFDVITSKWRRFDVITTLSLRHVFTGIVRRLGIGAKAMYPVVYHIFNKCIEQAKI